MYSFSRSDTLLNFRWRHRYMRKAYTKKGDEGYTQDYSGKQLRKDDPVIVTGGKIDSLQSAIDLVLLSAKGKTKTMLDEIQKKLWQSAGELSCGDKSRVMWPVTEKDISALEASIDSLGEPPQKFVRFNTQEAIQYNECRIRCRELETSMVKLLHIKALRPVVYQYINRLSSLFFMLAYKETK